MFVNSIVGSGNVIGKLCSFSRISGSGKITVNGKEITVPNGASISVGNGTVCINDEKVDTFSGNTEITINITGSVESIDCVSGDVHVAGNSGMCKSVSGDIIIGRDVNGNVNTTSGDVKVSGDIHGTVKTVSGDIRR